MVYFKSDLNILNFKNLATLAANGLIFWIAMKKISNLTEHHKLKIDDVQGGPKVGIQLLKVGFRFIK